MSDKIAQTHLQRRAVVYLRQSTLKQVRVNTESTLRQYDLRQRAIDLGWAQDRIDIVDEDLGRSGGSVEGRRGFQRVAEEVAHGRIGAIFALEVSRLTRSSADWHHLLELCGLADVVIVDERAVYCPRDYNDRALLGLKGAMSEAEREWMRLRLQGCKLTKARRGELRVRPPAGYVWDAGQKRFRRDPDEDVRRAISLVFERFRLDGSAYRVLRYLVRHGLQLPVRHEEGGDVSWVAPKEFSIVRMLHNPAYAGAYFYGRTEHRVALIDGKIHRHCVRRLPRDKWSVCLRDHHPGYIEWSEFEKNQNILESNRATHESSTRRGAVREGSALLQGIVLCGCCGHRMEVLYSGRRSRARYKCRGADGSRPGKTICWSVSAGAIDSAIEELVFTVLQPPEVELSLALSQQVAKQAADVDRQWSLRLERLRYEARMAERRYKAIDPDNRTVGRTLEGEWEAKLRELEDLEAEYARARHREKLDLTASDRALVHTLARDVRKVWNSRTTTFADRKGLVRLLVQQVTLTPSDSGEPATRVQVLWETGAVTETSVPGLTAPWKRTSSGAIKIIEELFREGRSDREIALELNHRGMTTGTQRSWHKYSVKRIRYRHGLQRRTHPAHGIPLRRKDGLYTARGVAARLRISLRKVQELGAKGQIRRVVKAGPGGTWWYKLERAVQERLRASPRSPEMPAMRAPSAAQVRTGCSLKRRSRDWPGTSCARRSRMHVWSNGATDRSRLR
jgi:DNA invertase Pin-like site-specific DNA recombinase